MPKYIISWSMSGEVELNATSPEDAQEQFDSMGLGEIADTNSDFNAEPPQTEEELEAEFERWRNSGDNALDNMLRDEIAAKMDAEKRNG
jgi:hypothetical protein